MRKKLFLKPVLKLWEARGIGEITPIVLEEKLFLEAISVLNSSIQRLNNNKSEGDDGSPAKLLKAAAATFNDKSDCKNYLLNAAYNIIAYIIAE